MGAKAEDVRTYDRVPMSFFLGKCRAIESGGLNVALKSENSEKDGRVWFRIHHGMTMMSYGEKITITLLPYGSGTRVHVHSTCGLPTQVIDYGKNRQNVNNIFKYLEDGIASAAAAIQSQRTVAPQPQRTVAPQPQRTVAPQQPGLQAQRDFIFCTECGARNPWRSRFCSSCGKPIIY